MSDVERTLSLEVVTPDRIVLSETAEYVRAPGALGSFGVLYGHAAFLTELITGELNYRSPDGRPHAVAVSGGFLQVLENRITVLADSAERREEIDVARAAAAAERARAARSLGPSGAQLLELDADLERALNRLRIAAPEDE